jgi:hypothetical protein
MKPAMTNFTAQAGAGAAPTSPTGAGGRNDFTPARRRPLRGNTMKMLKFGSALAIAAACAATSAYAKPSGAAHAAVKDVTVRGDNITETVVEKNKVNIVDVTIVGKDDTVTIEEIGKINSIVSSILGTGDTVVGIQIGMRNSFSSVAYGNSNTAVAIQFGKVSNVSAITQRGDYETAFVVQVGPHNFSSIVQVGPRTVPVSAAVTNEFACYFSRSGYCR